MFPITAPLGDFLQCDLRNRSKKIWNCISSRRIPPHWGHWQPIWSPTKQHGTYVFLNSVTLPAFSLIYHSFALVIGIYDSHYPAADRRRLLVAHQDNRATPVRAVASGGARGNSPPPPLRPVEPDKSSLFIDLFSLDSVILINSELQLFAIFIFGVDFSETYLMTSAESSVSEPPNLKNFLGRIPPDPPLQGSQGLREGRGRRRELGRETTRLNSPFPFPF